MVFKSAVDTKGRMNFPAKLREELGETFYITVGSDARCIAVFTVDEWKAYVEKINALPRAKAATAKRFLLGNKQFVEPDKQGRFVMSSELREYAEIEPETEVSIVGLEGYAEIWNSAKWKERQKPDNYDEIWDEIRENGL